MKEATKLVFDHEAFDAPQPERVTRKVLLNGKYATISSPKLKPSEKRKDPIVALMELRDDILRDEAAKDAAEKQGGDDGHREAA